MAVSSVSVSEPTIKNYTGTGSTIKKTNVDITGTYLKQETIDTLKQYDEESQIKPLTTRIATNALQQQDLTAITTLISQFKTSYADIASETSFLKRKTSIAGSNSVSANIEDGVAEQTIRMSVMQLAQSDSYQTKGFSSRSDVVFSNLSSDTKFSLQVGDKSYDITVNNKTTLDELSQKITDATDGKISVKILNVGGTNPYSMVFQTKDTGKDNAIKFKMEGNVSDNSLFKDLGFDTTTPDDKGVFTLKAGTGTNAGKKLANAQDAEFTFNGVNMTRSKNTIDDIITGATFTLNNVDDKTTSGEYKDTVISISKDTASLVKTMQSMVQAYNTLKTNLDTATSYDSESKAAGSLNGLSEITSIKRQINSIITNTDKNGKSLMDFGFSFTDKGVLSLDTKALESAISDDYENFKKFFSSNTTYENAVFYSSGSITSGTNAWTGKIKINDKEFDLAEIDKSITGNATSTNPSTQNTDKTKQAAELVKQINDAKIGVTASLDDDGKLVLKGVNDKTLKIEAGDGGDAALKALGLSAGSKTGVKSVNEGFFAKMNSLMDSLINSKNGSLTNFATELKDKNKLLAKQKERTQNSIDKKYEQMTTTFIAYASAIAKMTNSFSALQSMIDAQSKKD
ncbi:flagellar filament cap protein [Candidatus Campylobacter infans]|uniref:Flagellar hook-associated protein 2 n=1 Tax=Candidatus Campylobacter infans TaxID=2561898 RepID=A0A7H9CHX6_9BACT|nr:flagellar filament capping protein FliD [Candidatus Campylobacter infans]QLI04965.1 flagellar filament cap protein [Candidatus Campylobacter infans]